MEYWNITSTLANAFLIGALYLLLLVLIFFSLKIKRNRNQSNACWRLLQQVFNEAIKSKSISDLEDILAIQGQEITKLLATSFDEQGTTPLLTAIKHENCKGVIFLMENFGVDVNLHGTFEWSGAKYYNVSPLCAAIISRQVAIVDEFVIYGEERLDEVTADMEGIKKSSLDKEHKIEALELMGAIYALSRYDQVPRLRQVPSSYIISIWKEATRLRYSTVDGQPVIPKTIPPQSSYLLAKAMGFTLEFATLEHLEQLEAQLDFDVGFPELNLYTQALLVSQRMMHHNHHQILSNINISSPNCANTPMYSTMTGSTTEPSPLAGT